MIFERSNKLYHVAIFSFCSFNYDQTNQGKNYADMQWLGMFLGSNFRSIVSTSRYFYEIWDDDVFDGFGLSEIFG